MKFLFLLCFLLPINLFAQKPDLMLLGQYKNQDIHGWVMSEKLDGVRGFWDGTQLLSRQGNTFSPPDYFFKSFGTLLGLYALSAIFSWVSEFISVGVGARFAYSFRDKLLIKLDKLPLSYWHNHPVLQLS